MQSRRLKWPLQYSSIESIALESVKSASKLDAALGLIELISLATLAAESPFKSTTSTLDPCLARVLAIPSPMPCPEPVTKETLSFNSKINPSKMFF